jgi:putative membrane protein
MLEVDMLTATTEVLANGPHYGWGGPGPFFFIFPLLWFLLFATVIFLIARRARRGPRGGWGGPWAAHAAAGADPVTLLGTRFARGEIDEAEYRSRLTVLRSAEPYPTAPPSAGPNTGPTVPDAPPVAPTPQDQPPADENR